MVIESATNSVIESGNDTALGRWSWITLREKHNIHTTLISGYRPSYPLPTQYSDNNSDT